MRLFVLVMVVMLVSPDLLAQSTQQNYLKAKSSYTQGYYEDGITGFSNLANDPVFGSMSTFYLGLCQYRVGNNQKALDTWRQLLIKYPEFSQSEEVHLWISYVLFENGDFDRAVRQIQNVNDGTIRDNLYKQWLGIQSFQLLQQLQLEFDEDEELAKMTVKSSRISELTDADEKYLETLIRKFDIEQAELSDYDAIKKESYTIGVLLPFLFDDLSNRDRIMNNSLVTDLYQGMLLANEMLSEEGIEINLLPYDTQKGSPQTELILSTEDFSKVDLIIGPLYPEPIEVVNDFSKENEVNVINPVSSNSKVMDGNPYAFLLKPSYETMARKAAEFVASNSTKNESMIYFENKGAEKILAVEYKNAIEELGFDVTNFQPIDSKSARAVLARFSDQEESVLRITDEEAEKLLEEGRLIRSRRKFDASGNLITKEDGSPKLEYYEMNFTFDTDSLDHIFASTRSNLLANNFVGAVESIPDTVRLIGLGEWLDFSMLDYHQLERLDVNLIDSHYYDRSSDFYQKVYSGVIKNFKTEPSIYHLLGFESIWWSGNMMNKYGKYFQNGFPDETEIESIFYGHSFKNGQRDNQKVPIIQFVDRELRALNLSNGVVEE